MNNQDTSEVLAAAGQRLANWDRENEIQLLSSLQSEINKMPENILTESVVPIKEAFRRFHDAMVQRHELMSTLKNQVAGLDPCRSLVDKYLTEIFAQFPVQLSGHMSSLQSFENTPSGHRDLLVNVLVFPILPDLRVRWWQVHGHAQDSLPEFGNQPPSGFEDCPDSELIRLINEYEALNPIPSEDRPQSDLSFLEQLGVYVFSVAAEVFYEAGRLSRAIVIEVTREASEFFHREGESAQRFILTWGNSISSGDINEIAGSILGTVHGALEGVGIYPALDAIYYFATAFGGQPTEWGEIRHNAAERIRTGLGATPLHESSGFQGTSPAARTSAGIATIVTSAIFASSGGATGAAASSVANVPAVASVSTSGPSGAAALVAQGATLEQVLLDLLSGISWQEGAAALALFASADNSGGNGSDGDEPQYQDRWEEELFRDRTPEEITEIRRYMEGWDEGNFGSVARNIIYHSRKRGSDPLRYLRKAFNFNKRGARRIPRIGTRPDGTIRWERRSGEFLIERNGKIVTYGQN